MDAMPFDTSCEEEQLWTAAIEADQQIGREWLRRAELIARAHAVGAAAGRSEFVVCEVAAACCVDERTADVLLHEALELLGLPALVEAVDATSITLDATRYAVDAQTVFEDIYASISDARVGDEIEITQTLPDGTTQTAAEVVRAEEEVR